MWWRCLIYFGSCCLRVSFPLVVQPTGGSGAMAKMWGHHFNSVPIDHSIIAGCSWLTCWMCRPLDNVSNSFLICLLEILMWLRSPLFFTWVEQAEVSKAFPWTSSRYVELEPLNFRFSCKFCPSAPIYWRVIWVFERHRFPALSFNVRRCSHLVTAPALVNLHYISGGKICLRLYHLSQMHVDPDFRLTGWQFEFFDFCYSWIAWCLISWWAPYGEWPTAPSLHWWK